jgi:hypothetical protein
MEITGLAYANANHLVAKFEDLGLLTETTGGRRGRRSSYRPYLDLLTEDEANRPTSAPETEETAGTHRRVRR